MQARLMRGLRWGQSLHRPVPMLSLMQRPSESSQMNAVLPSQYRLSNLVCLRDRRRCAGCCGAGSRFRWSDSRSTSVLLDP